MKCTKKTKQQQNTHLHSFCTKSYKKTQTFMLGRRGERCKEIKKSGGGGNLQTEYFLSVFKFLFEVEVNLLNTEWTEINK